MGADDAPIAQECVEAYVYAGPGPKVLILRRPPSRGSIWVPVSGKVDPTDTGFESALRRELGEETGFTELRRLFSLDWVVPFDGPDGRRWRLHAYGVELDGPHVPRLSDEHEAYEWVTPAEAVRRLHYDDNRQAIERLLQRVSTVGATPIP